LCTYTVECTRAERGSVRCLEGAGPRGPAVRSRDAMLRVSKGRSVQRTPEGTDPETFIPERSGRKREKGHAQNHSNNHLVIFQMWIIPLLFLMLYIYFSK